MSKQSKIKELKEKFELNKPKTLENAVEILPQISLSKFVGTVDIEVQIALKEKQKKESMKGSVDLPHSFGGEKKVIVFCESADETKAKKAGATAAGLDKLITDVEKGSVDFDIVVATPEVMPKIARLGKTLGPKGLMPNPSNGTISKDIESTIKSFKSGKQNFKMEQGHGTVKTKIAKLDMKKEEILENISAFLREIVNESRKFGVDPIKKIILKPTMGPIVSLDVTSTLEAIK